MSFAKVAQKHFRLDVKLLYFILVLTHSEFRIFVVVGVAPTIGEYQRSLILFYG